MDTDTIIRVIQNVYKLLQERGHDTSNINKTIPKSILTNMIDNFRQGDPCLDNYINGTRKVYVHYIFKMKNEKKSNELEQLYNTISTSYNLGEDDQVIFVIFHQINEVIIDLENQFQNLTIFPYQKLLFNLIEHDYVPKHSLVLPEQKMKLLEILMIPDFFKLPLIYKTDPVCRYYNFKENDVIRIERPSIGNKTHIMYRLVV